MFQQLYTTLGYLALSQLILTGLFYFLYFRDSRLGLLVSLLCFCLIPAVLPAFENPQLLYFNYFLGRIGAATPAVLWLLAQALFIDDKKVGPVAWSLLIGYQLARGLVTFLDEIYGVSDTLLLASLNGLGLIVAFGLALHVIAMAIKEISNDLLEERRRIRGPFAAGMGIVMALLVASLLAPGFMSNENAVRFSQLAVVVSVALIFLFFLIANLLTFRLAPNSQLIFDGAFATSKSSSQELQLDEQDLQLVQELDKRMLEEKLFAESELTIGQLATLLSVQEYKLRLIINRKLGYKNFNQFLNHYRIREACVLLKKKSSHRNIAIVAQTVGYASLSTFNQAFKNMQGVTPTAYKNLHTIEEE